MLDGLSAPPTPTAMAFAAASSGFIVTFVYVLVQPNDAGANSIMYDRMSAPYVSRGGSQVSKSN